MIDLLVEVNISAVDAQRNVTGKMLIFYLLVTLTVLYWFWRTRPKSGEPPMMSGSLPLLGHAHMIAGGTIKLWDRYKAMTYECMRNGHAMYFLIGTEKFYVLTDPDDVLLVSNTCVQKDTLFGELIKQLLGKGLIFADVVTWRRHRKLILPTFSQQILDSFLTIFNNQSKKLMKKFAKESEMVPFDHTVHLRHNEFETICLSVMGIHNIDENEVLKYVQAFDMALENGLEKYQKFWLHFDFIYNKTHLRILQDYCMKTIKEMSETIWKLKQDLYKLNVEKKVDKTETKPFLEHLLENNDKMSDQEIKDQISMMLVAGSDTSSSSLIFALILIGSHPNVQEKIYAELLDVFDGLDRDVRKEDLSKLLYLEAVLKETMRYYNIAPFVVRYIDKEVKLKNCTLQPGNNCILSIYGVHRHPVWEDAEEFRPQRWFENTLPSNPNAFVPFSMGKRNCIGRSFAMMSMKIKLCHLLRKFKIHADKTKLQIRLDVLIKPASGYFISIENRKFF